MTPVQLGVLVRSLQQLFLCLGPKRAEPLDFFMKMLGAPAAATAEALRLACDTGWAECVDPDRWRCPAGVYLQWRTGAGKGPPPEFVLPHGFLPTPPATWWAMATPSGETRVEVGQEALTLEVEQPVYGPDSRLVGVAWSVTGGHAWLKEFKNLGGRHLLPQEQGIAISARGWICDLHTRLRLRHFNCVRSELQAVPATLDGRCVLQVWALVIFEDERFQLAPRNWTGPTASQDAARAHDEAERKFFASLDAFLDLWGRRLQEREP